MVFLWYSSYTSPGSAVGLSIAVTPFPNSRAIQQGVQCSCTTSVCCLSSRHKDFVCPRPFEYLRLATLGVMGALVKVPDTRVIIFLLSSEIMPLCLRAMETGSALSRAEDQTARMWMQQLLDNLPGRPVTKEGGGI
ncbi:UNVERIFIED_CONTAM: CCR4-NOT transcription complex subunit [Sesamum angustifolium]|uniref:CCR4-NOT transcription complex subunit n=1 Tax=Sesamum angustifolium TaxID=2727405 RepID=A0AAW2PFT2_9LAMI